MAKFLVTKGNGGSMLGYQTVIKLGIIQMNHKITLSKPPPINATDTFFDTLKSEYPKVFSGKIGKLKNFKLKLHMDKSVKPASHKHRFTPYYLRDLIKRELETPKPRYNRTCVRTRRAHGMLSQIVPVQNQKDA